MLRSGSSVHILLVKGFHKRLGSVKKISESAVRRLSPYLRLLRDVAGKQALISSQELEGLTFALTSSRDGERSHA